mmetsp:Transcript_20301/g.56396  ORF Transcript_20301/g.56396 Transcript_20301/m.56396 type:complete len:247 (-) Transcript_20301:103-843(-)
MEYGVVALVWERHTERQEPHTIRHEPHRIASGGLKVNVAPWVDLLEKVEVKDAWPCLVYLVVVPTDDEQEQGREEVYQYRGHVIRIMEEQGVPQYPRRQKQRSAGDAPRRRKQRLPQGVAKERVGCARIHDKRQHHEHCGEVGDPTKITPIKVLLRRGLDLIHPTQGKKDRHFHDVNDPQVLGNSTKAPRHENGVGYAEYEIALVQSFCLQTVCPLLDRIDACVDDISLFLRDPTVAHMLVMFGPE